MATTALVYNGYNVLISSNGILSPSDKNNIAKDEDTNRSTFDKIKNKKKIANIIEIINDRKEIKLMYIYLVGNHDGEPYGCLDHVGGILCMTQMMIHIQNQIYYICKYDSKKDDADCKHGRTLNYLHFFRFKTL